MNAVIPPFSSVNTNFNKTKSYHKFWAAQIANMNDKKLKENHIGLSPVEAKNLAKQVFNVLP